MAFTLIPRDRRSTVDRRGKTPPEFRDGYQSGLAGDLYDINASGEFKSGWVAGCNHRHIMDGYK